MFCALHAAFAPQVPQAVLPPAPPEAELLALVAPTVAPEPPAPAVLDVVGPPDEASFEAPPPQATTFAVSRRVDPSLNHEDRGIVCDARDRSARVNANEPLGGR
jgi:hypothetical protein